MQALRDQRAAGRLLFDRCRRSRRSHHHGRQDPGRALRQYRGASDHDLFVIHLAQIYRADWGRLLAALIRALGDFDVAEEALQEAFAAAVESWKTDLPDNAQGWIYATARHKALDRLRQRSLHAQKLAEYAEATSAEQTDWLQ